MLKLTDIKKDYVLSGGDKVPALKGINLEFRQSEFVSILGASGCGKTTLLNIIGGLDRYTSGDMSIDGISTQHYSDVDWDAYRNIRIGFIFQSYNLISHIDVLSNVEMSLLLAGVSKAERKERAIKALEEVGLKDHIHKKPNQLSGGQMQRVSIARALINNPNIILADEPTGALDSTTSVQIMEILKEISKDKLIIMVTHNPELAEQYSNRIVRLKDGEVVDDSNPYASESISEQNQADEEQGAQAAVESQSEEIKQAVALEEVTCADEGGNKKKVKVEFQKRKAKKERKNKLKLTSMSFFSAIKLSFTNLMTKKGRTFMTAFAGSIGIIGVALVLAISNGFSNYVANMQRTMLSGYPITITSNTMSMESMMTTYMSVMNGSQENKYTSSQIVYSYNLSKILMEMITPNDINENYIAYLDDKKVGWKDNGYVDSVYYNYGYDYSVYNIKGKNVGKSGMAAMSSDRASVNWQEAVGDRTYMESAFDVIGGKYPESPTEVMLVVDSSNTILSSYFAGMGFDGLIDEYEGMDTSSLISRDRTFDEILGTSRKEGVTFKVPNNSARYKQAINQETGRTYFVEKSYDEIKDLGEEDGVYKLSVVGILRPKEGSEYSPVATGIVHTQELTALLRADAKDSEIVKFQQECDYNVLTGENFDSESMLPSDFMGIMSGESTVQTYKTVMQALGGSDIPTAISIYPSTFENKALVLADLDAWNANPENEKNQIKYTDSAAIFIGMMNQIIRIITIALICFSSVSLVVSSIMIGIITYVSVVERTKEIGILRSLGARKRDVSNIFNAESVIIGFTAGLIGVIVTYILSIPINLIITSLEATITGICALNPLHAILMILLSITLTSIAGLVPARIAAKRDPVVALRTE
ncbi:MAG: ATP-binding cassette domain-containing protein [Clostridia bacterium]|nr:ATP-binding cassette domain-containing protein [Clostridia bacterium]MDE7328273.1 ATP-binding cassette domain-containing protein [Clostridia bacterium]